MLRLIDKDRQRMDNYKRPVRRLRKNRQAWQKKQRAARLSALMKKGMSLAREMRTVKL